MLERLFHGRGTGKGLRPFESSVGTLGGLMCGEHTNPLAVYALLSQGEQLHAASWTAFPEHDRDRRETRVGVRTRYHAFIGGVPTVSATGVVTEQLAASVGESELQTGGGTSSVIAPSGDYLAGPMYEGEGIVSAQVDMGDYVRSHSRHDVTGHYNRFDIFTLTVDRSSDNPIQFRGGKQSEHMHELTSEEVSDESESGEF
jgi:aliphatic nitrilase